MSVSFRGKIRKSSFFHGRNLAVKLSFKDFMKLPFASFAFFCAAGALSFPQISMGEDETVYNLKGSTDKSVSGDLTVIQNISGTYSGALSVSGTLTKQGDANLTLNGSLDVSTISNTAGMFTFGNALVFSQSAQWTVANSAGATLVLQNSSEQLSVSGESSGVGNVVVNAAEELSAASLSGENLTIRAGTLTVTNSISFSEIAVEGGATLQVGTGAQGSLATLSGNVSLADNASLIFNRIFEAGAIEYSDAISGSGNVVINGTAPVYFTEGTNQLYTGTTTINEGAMFFRATTGVEAANLASARVIVNAGGIFGGHVSVAGDVEINGADFTYVSDWTAQIGTGALLYTSAGTTLTINGDLKIAKTSVTPYYTVDDDGNITGIVYSGNSGGAIRVVLSDSGAGKIVANGNAELGGTLILYGNSSLAVSGTPHVFFTSDPSKTTGAFDNVVYGSDNVVLLLPSVGGVGEGSLGIAAVESRNVRKRAAFSEHKGTEEFVDYLVANANAMNKITQAVAFADSASVSSVVNNFSALSFSAFPELAQRQSEAEWNMILQEILRVRLAPPNSEDGVRVPANFEFFSGFVADFVNHAEDDENAPIYDFNDVGVYAGGMKWIDDERLAGAALGFHRGDVNIHGNGGSLEDLAFRAKIFAVFTPKFSDWALTIGGTFGAHHYDTDRDTAIGRNSGSSTGVDSGIFISFDSRSQINADLFFTPYIRFEYNFSYVSGFEESGSASRLKTEHFTMNNYRLRFGSGVEYAITEGRTFGVEFGFVANFGEKPGITAEFLDYSGSKTTIDGTRAERMAFEIAPRYEVDLGKNWTLDAMYRANIPFSGGEVSHGIGIGFNKKF